MPVLWVLEKNILLEDCVERMKKEIVQQGHEYKNIEYVPFGSTDLTPFSGNPQSVFYGSLNLANQILRSNLTDLPIVYCDLYKFRCSYYYAYFYPHLLNGVCDMFPLVYLQEAEYRELLSSMFGHPERLFIRPDRGDKSFTGFCVPFDWWNKEFGWDDFWKEFDYPPFNEMVVAAEEKDIRAEWRFVVADGEVITGSIYKINGSAEQELCDRGYAFDFAQDVVDDVNWEPDRLWTIDVCREDKEEMKVLEINSFSCSGLYACDMELVVSKASEIVKEERPT